MFSYVIRKMRNKRWLNLCLLAGIILFTAVFACHPMFEKGAENKILQQLFTDYAEEQERYPAVLSYVSGSETGFHSLQEAYDKMDALRNDWQKNMGVRTVCSMSVFRQRMGTAALAEGTGCSVSGSSEIWRNIYSL